MLAPELDLCASLQPVRLSRAIGAHLCIQEKVIYKYRYTDAALHEDLITLYLSCINIDHPEVCFCAFLCAGPVPSIFHGHGNGST